MKHSRHRLLILTCPADSQTGVQKVIDLKNVPLDSLEAKRLVEKYKYFYFSKYSSLCICLCSRRITPIDPPAFEQWRAHKMRINSTASASEDNQNPIDPSRPWFMQAAAHHITETTASDENIESKGPSFDEIVELISTGKPVPGIRQIPEKLSLEAPSTSSSPAPPKKPWEK
jgi:hypothetical protein